MYDFVLPSLIITGPLHLIMDFFFSLLDDTETVQGGLVKLWPIGVVHHGQFVEEAREPQSLLVPR